MPRTDFIDLSSNESSPIQNHPTNTTLDTTLSLTIPSPTISQTNPTQGTNVSPLAPRPIVLSTPPGSPLKPHTYLNVLDDLPPRSSNPPPPSLSQGLSQTLPQQTPMDFELSFPPINLSRSKMSAQPEPFLSREQVMQELSQYQDLDHHLEAISFSLMIEMFNMVLFLSYVVYYLNKLLLAKISEADFLQPVPSSYTGQFHYGNGTATNRATVLAGSIGLHWPVPSWQWNWRNRATCFGEFLNRRNCANFCLRDQASRFTYSKYLSSHEDLTGVLKSSFTIIVNQDVCHIVLGAF
ncbi:hypothetical protein Tco_0542785 [Tanacetum coccineum]